MNQKMDDAKKAFEDGVAATNDHVLLKRHYAPFLASQGDNDRAMDLCEDVLEVAPYEVRVLIEYFEVLDRAGRTHEVPDVLKTLLSNENLDPDLRAQAKARLSDDRALMSSFICRSF